MGVDVTVHVTIERKKKGSNKNENRLLKKVRDLVQGIRLCGDADCADFGKGLWLTVGLRQWDGRACEQILRMRTEVFWIVCVQLLLGF